VEASGWDVGVIALKALSYASTLGAAGLLFFLLYAQELLTQAECTLFARVSATLAMIAALASVAKLLLLAGSMSGEMSGMADPSNLTMLWEAGERTATGMRVIALVLSCAVLIKTPRSIRNAALAGALAAVSFAGIGHAHAAAAKLPAMLLLCLHLLGTAFWVGALWPLSHMARHRAQNLHAVVLKFSQLALLLVGILVVAGIALLSLLLKDVTELWMSDYGRMMLAKLALVAVLLGAAAYNKFKLTPKLAQADDGAVQSLRRSIKLEMGLVAGILLTTAVFTTVSGP
jgi:putative copper resistance protein D